jgi:hypothetical protein
MSTELQSIPANHPSLCIPRVFNNINEAAIRLVFNKLDLGNIHHVDIVVKKSDKGETYKRVYIHFTTWFWNRDAIAARQTLLAGKEIKVVYDAPWFWKVSANRSATPSHSSAVHPSSKVPYIDFGTNVAPALVAPALTAPVLAPALTAPALKVKPQQKKPKLNPKAHSFKPATNATNAPPNAPEPEPVRDQEPVREPRDEDNEPDVEYNVLPIPPKPPKRVTKILKRAEEPATQMVPDSLYEDL